MAPALDHLIIAVNDLDESAAFYTSILGMTDEGMDGPFAVVRVSPDLVLLFSGHGTDGNDHYAFSFSPDEFAQCFERIKAAGVPYGNAYDTVGNGQGPALERGAHGDCPSLYFWDPNHHLLEIRHDA